MACSDFYLHAAGQVTRVAAESPTRAPCFSCSRDASCDLFSEISTALMLCLDFTILRCFYIWFYNETRISALIYYQEGEGGLFSLVYDKGRAIWFVIDTMFLPERGGFLTAPFHIGTSFWYHFFYSLSFFFFLQYYKEKAPSHFLHYDYIMIKTRITKRRTKSNHITY